MGSASDADTDAAFALVMAARQWGGSYGADATALIGAIKEAEVDTTAPYLRGGSNYRGAGLTRTNPSYFSPAFYRVFAQHTGDTSWNTLANNVYNLLGSISNAGGVQNGLVPAWCNSSCTGPESNGASTDNLYQYDSHRTPWRIGMDYCWYGTAAAQSYLMKVIPFFANTAGGNGVGRIFDLYDPTNSREASGAAVNSASLIGMAASGAMFNASTYRAFLDDGYQLVFDLLNRGTLAELGDGTKSAYSYFNATVGMMALLTMTGEFALFP
jgi:endo-1,4-beta-D-glucanase Y